MQRRDLTGDKRFNARAVAAYAAGPASPRAAFKAAAGDAPAEIFVYGVVGQDYWGEGTTASDVVGFLAQAGAAPVTVRINSPGGDAFDGLAIYNVLRAHAPGVTVQVDGIAASAASIIAMAGNPLIMPVASMLMIHNARIRVAGSKEDFAAIGAALTKIDGVMAGVYASKSGKPAADMTALMDAETYLTADEAEDLGLCDTVLGDPDATEEVTEPTPAALAPVTFHAEVVDTTAAQAALAAARARHLHLLEIS